jgi:hypothetical protein
MALTDLRDEGRRSSAWRSSGRNYVGLGKSIYDVEEPWSLRNRPRSSTSAWESSGQNYVGLEKLAYDVEGPWSLRYRPRRSTSA